MSKERIMITRPIMVPFGPMDLVFSNVVLLKRYSLSFEHEHPHFELHLVTKGASIVHVDDEAYQVSEGQLCWINPGVRRYVETKRDSESEHFVLHFDFMPREVNDVYSFLEFRELSTFLLLVRSKKIWISDDNNRGKNIFEFLVNELDRKGYGYMLVVRNMLCSFVVEAIQNIGIQGLPEGKDSELDGSNLAFKVLSYIRDHYSEEITIEKTAKQLNISTRHLTRLLKDTFGTTFKKSLEGFRVAHVQDRLMNSKDSMQQIAESTGFPSTAAMAENFKKITGRTLQEYRKTESTHKTIK